LVSESINIVREDLFHCAQHVVRVTRVDLLTPESPEKVSPVRSHRPWWVVGFREMVDLLAAMLGLSVNELRLQHLTSSRA
jgi:hypothetical protein